MVYWLTPERHRLWVYRKHENLRGDVLTRIEAMYLTTISTSFWAFDSRLGKSVNEDIFEDVIEASKSGLPPNNNTLESLITAKLVGDPNGSYQAYDTTGGKFEHW
jgi:hypothetical protein